jgi:uncharacterized protein YlxP (DUF503 family)
MHIAYAKITLQLTHVHSLKQKRQILRSLMDKLTQRFNLTIAEVEHNDQWQLAGLGIVMISNERRHVESQLNKVLTYWQQELHIDAQIIDIEQHIMTTN